MLKHLLKDAIKTIEKALLYYKDVNIERRNHNGGGLAITGMNATQIGTLQKTMLIPLIRYFTDLGNVKIV